MTRREKVIAEYEKGVRARAKYACLEEWAYDGNEPSWDDLLDLAWDAGWYGRECPVQATGWRYGDIPSAGKSYNRREQCYELGISMMYIKTVDGGEYRTADIVSAMFAEIGREKITVSGWFVGFGGDGEPLLLK